MQTLSRDSMPSADTVISLDLEPVSFDLTPIPLDEILEFREANRYSHRAYMRDLRRFMVELADIDDERTANSFSSSAEKKRPPPSTICTTPRVVGSVGTERTWRHSRSGSQGQRGPSTETSILSVSRSPPGASCPNSSPGTRLRSLPTPTCSTCAKSSATIRVTSEHLTKDNPWHTNEGHSARVVSDLN